MKRILVVDDEKNMRRLLTDYLHDAGFMVQEAKDGEEALRFFDADPDFSLIILDLMLPKVDGYEVLSRIRETSQVPVILLTARSEEEDELLGFLKGADEYVTKPFSPRALVARVEAVLRRSGAEEEGKVVSAGGIILDHASHTVTADGKTVDLSVREFALLSFFLENAGIALSRETILNRVWGYDYFGDARTVDTHVKNLRAKCGEPGKAIQTVWGVGYRFAPDK